MRLSTGEKWHQALVEQPLTTTKTLLNHSPASLPSAFRFTFVPVHRSTEGNTIPMETPEMALLLMTAIPMDKAAQKTNQTLQTHLQSNLTHPPLPDHDIRGHCQGLRARSPSNFQQPRLLHYLSQQPSDPRGARSRRDGVFQRLHAP
ncbi:hypothetical protein KC326_g117 [Hortaea werneckii]|nr:hypothetical protein KC326_g117 [Hortaea werneckii]